MDVLELLKYAIGLIQLLLIAASKHMYNELKEAKSRTAMLEKELSDHKLHTSETYMTKTELTRAFDTISRSIESLGQSLGQRFDKVEEKLDRKADKKDH